MTHNVTAMFGMCCIYCTCQTLTLLAAVDLIVFYHELFELAQQLDRLLTDKEQTDTQNQQHEPHPWLIIDVCCLLNKWTVGVRKRQQDER